MLRSQRILLIVGLLVIAWLMHVVQCDWVFNDIVGQDRVQGYDSPRHSLLLTLEHGGQSGTRYTGLITGLWVGHTEGLLLGVVVPLLFAVGAGYVALGLRRAARAERGHCLACGYDLRGRKDISGKCPECGAATSHAG